MAEQTQDLGFSLADYAAVLRRRWLGSALVALLVVLAAVALAWFLPATYQSEGTVLVEREDIPEGLVPSTVTGYAQERIENIKRRALTRERLLEMAGRHNLYSEPLSSGDQVTAVTLMRQALNIELLDVEQNPGSRKGQAKVVIAFTVAFEADTPEVARAVVSEIMAIFLEENQALRIEQSGEVVDFFQRTASTLQEEVEGIEQRISDYKQTRTGALPENQQANQRNLALLEQDLVRLDNRERELRNERNELSVQLESMDQHFSGASGNGRVVSPAQQLVQAKAELAAARERYSAIHPEIGRLKLLIAGLEKEIGVAGLDGQSGASAAPTNPEYLRVASKLTSLGVDLDALAAQRTNTRADIGALEASIGLAPEVDRELRAMSMELESTRKQFRELKDKQLDARLASDVEIDKKGGGFRVLEPASLPSVPVSPDRAGIVALGVLAALLLALLWMFMAEFMDRSVRGYRGVLQVSGVAPIAIIPNMGTS